MDGTNFFQTNQLREELGGRDKELAELKEALIDIKAKLQEKVVRVEEYVTADREWLQEKSALQERLQKAEAKQRKVLEAIQDQEQE